MMLIVTRPGFLRLELSFRLSRPFHPEGRLLQLIKYVALEEHCDTP
jgi:hypothetical protein